MGRKKPLILCALYSTAVVGMTCPANANETVTYAYDAQGRLKAVTSSGTVNNGQAYSWCYDDAGNRLIAQTSNAGAVANCSLPPPPPPPPAAPSISIADEGTFEGDTLFFVLTLSASSSSSISVNYATAYGSAGSADFYARSGVVTFSPGQTSQFISVTTKTDLVFEPIETFTVNLSNPTAGATLADGQAIGSIYNMESEPTCGKFAC